MIADESETDDVKVSFATLDTNSSRVLRVFLKHMKKNQSLYYGTIQFIDGKCELSARLPYFLLKTELINSEKFYVVVPPIV